MQTKASSVESVQAQLGVAEHRLEQTEIAAIQAAEAFNAARYHAQQAAQAAERRPAPPTRPSEPTSPCSARPTPTRSARPTSSVPSLSPLAALVNADGVSGVLEGYDLIEQAAAAIDDTYETYAAAVDPRRVRRPRADQALAEADDAKAEAKEARDQAEAAAETRPPRPRRTPPSGTRLIAELAELQDISVELARERQEALEQGAAEAAASLPRSGRAARRRRRPSRLPQRPRSRAPQDAAARPPSRRPTPTPTPRPDSDADPAPPHPDPHADADPDAAAPDSPRTGGGAGAAISFARAQLGEPYHYGAAGPNSWDCSGLTMMAWKQGGKSLPHYSAGQYSASTPIGIGAPAAGRPALLG